MELPYDSSVNPDDMVIRDLFDLSFLCEEHPEMLENGNTLKITFDLGVSAGDTVIAMVYVDGQWIPVELINNGDGTVTVVYEDHFCPNAFAVKQGVGTGAPQTGDDNGSQLVVWGSVFGACVLGLIAVVIVFARKRKHA